MDLVYSLNEYVSFNAGVRYSYNNDGTTTSFGTPPGTTTPLGADQNFWGGGGVAFAF